MQCLSSKKINLAMTTQERKSLVLRLGKQFLNETNTDNMKFIITEIISQVMSAAYDQQNIYTARSGIKEWGDLNIYISAAEKNQLTEKLKLSANLCLVGLSTLIDLAKKED